MLLLSCEKKTHTNIPRDVRLVGESRRHQRNHLVPIAMPINRRKPGGLIALGEEGEVVEVARARQGDLKEPPPNMDLWEVVEATLDSLLTEWQGARVGRAEVANRDKASGRGGGGVVGRHGGAGGGGGGSDVSLLE